MAIQLFFLQEKKTKKIKLDNHIKIGLNLNYSGWRGFGKYKKEILESYERVAEYFQKKYKAKVYYLQHHPSEKVILKKLKVADIIKVDLSPYQQKYIYSQMDLIIGMMLHSCVLAFGAGTPEINVVYDVRNKNFAKFIKCPELTVNLDGLKQGELLKKSIEVFNKKKFYQEKFVSTKEKIWQKHEDFLNQINNLIK
ncbi:MAG: polysaccharide pyruvyl transferase family protein [Candidatus Falkowbacteria bacterium]